MESFPPGLKPIPLISDKAIKIKEYFAVGFEPTRCIDSAHIVRISENVHRPPLISVNKQAAWHGIRLYRVTDAIKNGLQMDRPGTELNPYERGVFLSRLSASCSFYWNPQLGDKYFVLLLCIVDCSEWVAVQTEPQATAVIPNETVFIAGRKIFGNLQHFVDNLQYPSFRSRSEHEQLRTHPSKLWISYLVDCKIDSWSQEFLQNPPSFNLLRDKTEVKNFRISYHSLFSLRQVNSQDFHFPNSCIVAAKEKSKNQNVSLMLFKKNWKNIANN